MAWESIDSWSQAWDKVVLRSWDKVVRGSLHAVANW